MDGRRYCSILGHVKKDVMTALFISVWFCACGVFLFATKLTDTSFLKVSEIQVFLGLAFLMSFLGYPILYFHLNEYRVMTGITDRELIIAAMLASAWALIGAMFVYSLFVSVFSSARSHKGCSRKELQGGCDTRYVLLGFLVFMQGTTIAATYLYLEKAGSIALVEVFTGGDVASARSRMTNDFSGRYHWYRLFFYDFSWIIALTFYALAFTFRSKITWFLFSFSFLCMIFFLTTSVQKAPIVFFLGTVFLVHAYIRSNKKISMGKISVLGVIGLASLVVMYTFFMGSSDVSSALSSTASRALTGQLSGAYNYQWIFPEQVDHLRGKSFPNPGGILPFEQYPLTREVMAIVHPHLADRGVVGSQPTMYWGEAYANFGWLGVLVAPLYVGAYIFFWKWCVGLIKSTPVRAVATVWVSLQLARFAFSGLSWSLLPVTLVAGFLLLITADRLFRANISLSLAKKRWFLNPHESTHRP